MAAAIAAYRAGNAPAIVQVFEVGTATMMAAKGAIKPVYQLMAEAGEKFDPKAYSRRVAGYYSTPRARCCRCRSTARPGVLYQQGCVQEGRASIPISPPKTWRRGPPAAEKIKAAGATPCAFTTGWQSWVQLESFSAWHNVPFATKQNGFGGSTRASSSTGQSRSSTSQTMRRLG